MTSNFTQVHIDYIRDMNPYNHSIVMWHEMTQSFVMAHYIKEMTEKVLKVWRISIVRAVALLVLTIALLLS